MKNFLIGLAVVALLAIGAVYFINRGGNTATIPPSEPPPPVTEPSPAPMPPAVQGATIHMTDTAGFSPVNVTIKKGEAITFINDGVNGHWPASNLHPTHTLYPGSGIEKCGTADQPNIFDACRGLNHGESWSFTFNNVGSWRYHDHLFPTTHGTITVTE